MDLLKPFTSRSFVIGIGIAALAYLIGPTIQRNAKAVAVRGMQGALAAGAAASNVVTSGRERMSGVIDSMVSSKDIPVQQMLSELRAEREQYTSVLQELVGTMKNMQEEIAMLKGGQGNL